MFTHTHKSTREWARAVSLALFCSWASESKAGARLRQEVNENPQVRINTPTHGTAFSNLSEVTGTIVEGDSKVVTGKHAIRWKIFVSLIHSQSPNDHWRQEGINADAETEVFSILCWSKFVALWFILKGRHYTHWVEHKLSLGLSLLSGIGVTGSGASQPVIWGG